MKALLKIYFLTGLIFTITTIGITPANASEGKFVTINGTALYYEVRGDSSSPYYPILLLHGGFADIDSWKFQIDELANDENGFQVIALESRGHGRSRGETGDITYALMADDVAKFIYFLQGKDPEDPTQDSTNDPIIDTNEVSIVGWSDGGVIALNVCKVHKDLVHKAVIVGANVQSENAFISDGYLSFGNILNTEGLFNSMASMARPEWIDKKKSEWGGSRQNWRTKWPTFRDTMRAVWQTPCYIPQDPDTSCLESLGTIETPVYVVAGRNEETILEDHTNAIADNIPNSQRKIFDVDTENDLPASHLLPQQQPDAFNALVVSYLSN